jgi:hypothetical protein
MPKKLLTVLTAVLIVAALAAMPAVAQATPHYYVNGTKLPEGERVPILEWGLLTMNQEPETSVRFTTCEVAAGGFIENPVGGGAGSGQTTRFATWNCTNRECPPGEVETGEGHKYETQSEIIAPPQDLPWSSLLTEAEAGKIRTDSTGVVLTDGCYARKVTRTEAGEGGSKGAGENELYPLTPAVNCETNATHLWEPQHHNGTNQGNNQSTLIFNQPEGSGLTCANGTSTGRFTGSLKVMGYDASELITVKNS